MLVLNSFFAFKIVFRAVIYTLGRFLGSFLGSEILGRRETDVRFDHLS